MRWYLSTVQEAPVALANLAILWNLAGFRRPLLALRGMYEPCDPDAEQVQHDHGRGEDAHVHDVGGRRNDRGDDEDHQDGIPEVPPHPAGAQNPHQRQEENQDRHLEDDA